MPPLSIRPVGRSLTAGDAPVGPRTRISTLGAVFGGLLGALLSTSCCILPLALFSLGAGSAWLGTLAALNPYQPAFLAATVGFLGFGYWRVYRRPEAACAGEASCGTRRAGRLVRATLWTATLLAVAAGAFPLVAPTLLGV